MITLKEIELLDKELGMHFAYHKSLKTITEIHNHDFYEIFIVVKGEVKHFVNDKEFLLKEGNLVFIRPFDTHYYTSVDNLPCEITNIAFPGKTLDKIFKFIDAQSSISTLLIPKHPPTILIEQMELIHLKPTIMEPAINNMNNKKELKRFLLATLASIFVNYFLKQPKNKRDDQSPAWLTNLISEMSKKENFTAGPQRLYEIAGKSREHISRVIKKHYNKTPTDLVNDLKLEYAVNLLIYTDMEVLDISLSSGFNNLSHFYHQFKNKYNTSPVNYRKNYRKNIIP